MPRGGGGPDGRGSLEQFAAELPAVAWFAAVGLPLPKTVVATASRYLIGLGYRDVTVGSVSDWRAAADVTRDPAWEQGWWAREEAHRRNLLDACAGALGEKTALDLLTTVTEQANAVVLDAASDALARFGTIDPFLARVAAGAAAQAVYQAALARLAGEDAADLFVAKFDLFRAGRWPLGIVGGALRVF